MNAEPTEQSAPAGDQQRNSRSLMERIAESPPASRPVARDATRATGAEPYLPKGGGVPGRNAPADFATLTTGLDEAATYIRLGFWSFIGLAGLILIGTLAAAGFLVASISSEAGWQRLAATGTATAIGVCVLLLLQYRPPQSFLLAGPRLAALEARRAQLRKSFEWWDRFLNETAATSEDVAKAVSSLAAATEAFVAADPRARAAAAGAAGPDAGPPSRKLLPHTFLRRSSS